MKQWIIPYFGMLLFLAALGFLTIRAIELEQTPDNEFSQRVNLALRQTAHELLRLEKDSTSIIKPVQQLAANAWLISLEQNFSYDSLPTVLHQALSLQDIPYNYNVAVLDCYKKELMLGYNSKLYLAGKEVPCGGRERVAGCYQLTITFLNQSKGSAWKNGIAVAAVVAFLAFQGYHVWYKARLIKKQGSVSNKEVAPVAATNSEDSSQAQYFRFGQSSLDITNQKLWIHRIQKDLTYRETKLLQLFCRNQNKLLEREYILKVVWEDEGILVGRSVDVFVSRLRKLLKEDPSVKIVNVHSVGYRFEVNNE